MVCPGDHIALAHEFLSSCRKFLIIGTSGLNGDLFELLDTAIDPRSHFLVHVVGKDGVEETLSRFAKNVRAFNTPGAKSSAVTYAKGFKEYVAGDLIRTFAESNC